MMIDMNKPLELGSDEADNFLKSLQGNILESHQRSNAAHLFISFGAQADEDDPGDNAGNARAWIRGLLDGGDIISAFDDRNSDRTATFLTLMLSSAGYRFLGQKRPKDSSFRDGMRERGDKLHDANPATWETDYKYEDRGKRVHALLIVADKVDAVMRAKTASIEAGLAGIGLEALVTEFGNQKKNASGDAVEHFGYRDGVSQPRFIMEAGEDFDTVPPGVSFDQRTPLKRVLEEDRLAKGTFGSFAVYRKLEQDVASFDAAAESVAAQIGSDAVLVGAQAVGRFKNGNPLVLSNDPNAPYDATGEGRFNYSEDEPGDKCPVHAHIRKVNPRNSLGLLAGILAREAKRRIARRGITYGPTAGKVGLIFVCYQSDIKDQFEFIQRRWANNHSFDRRGAGLDPLIGQDGGPQERNDHPKWPIEYGSGDHRRVAFGEHIRLRGGEYFFAPSLEGLAKLGAA